MRRAARTCRMCFISTRWAERMSSSSRSIRTGGTSSRPRWIISLHTCLRGNESELMAGRDAIAAGEASELAGELLEASAAYSSAVDDPDPVIAADAHFHLARV